MDKKLLKLQRKAQEVIVAASVKNSYQIVKLLFADGYKIFDKFTSDKEFYPDGTTFIRYERKSSFMNRCMSLLGLGPPWVSNGLVAKADFELKLKQEYEF